MRSDQASCQHEPGGCDLGFSSGGGLWTGHLKNWESDGQPSKSGEWAGRCSELVGDSYWLTRQRLNVPDIAENADSKTDGCGCPGPDLVAARPAVEIGDVESQFADHDEHIDLGWPGQRLPRVQAVCARPVV